MQALVSGQAEFPASPSAELNVSYAEFKAIGTTVEDSDDEDYVYVARLAEQIAHAMLDEEEDIDASQHYHTTTMPRPENVSCASFTKEGEHSVSHFAAIWRDNGPSEWDCFYTPMHQLDSKSLSAMRGAKLEDTYMLAGWRSHSLNDCNKISSSTLQTWSLASRWNSQLPSHILSKPKESIGTGVFLPKIARAGSYHRRKVGLHSKSAYAPRSKY